VNVERRAQIARAEKAGKLVRRGTIAGLGVAAGAYGAHRIAQSRRARVEKADDGWRGYVSPKAIEAHDKVLPKYHHAKEQDALANAVTGAVGVGLAHRGAKLIRSGYPSRASAGVAGAGLAGLGALTTLGGVSGYRRNVRGAKDIDNRRGMIRARGRARRAEARDALSKGLAPKASVPMLKKTSGMKQRSFVRSGSVRSNPSGTMTSVNGSTR
jgi:hypothetical protein